MNAIAPMPGSGHFQWNTSGWFGSQLGGTVWMLAGAASCARQAPRIATVWLGCFLFAIIIGTWMWRRRDRLRPYPALQVLLLVVGVSGLVALISVDALRPASLRLDMPPSEMRMGFRALLIGVPVLMAWFALQERAAMKARSKT